MEYIVVLLACWGMNFLLTRGDSTENKYGEVHPICLGVGILVVIAFISKSCS